MAVNETCSAANHPCCTDAPTPPGVLLNPRELPHVFFASQVYHNAHHEVERKRGGYDPIRALAEPRCVCAKRRHYFMARLFAVVPNQQRRCVKKTTLGVKIGEKCVEELALDPQVVPNVSPEQKVRLHVLAAKVYPEPSKIS